MRNPEKRTITVELLQYTDFLDESYYDETYNNNKYMPYTVFKLGDNNAVESISIVITEDHYESSSSLVFRPIDLFQMSFWTKIEDVKDSSYSFCFATSAFLGGIRPCEESWSKNESSTHHPLPSYKIPNPIDSFDNIWNGYVLHTGATSISRHDFCIWVFRLSCLVYDLVEKPINTDGHWKERYLKLVDFVSMKFSDKYEYLVSGGWAKARRKECIEREQAFEYRLEDAKALLRDFNQSMGSDDPLERFLREFYEDFGKLLFEKGLLLKCDYCGSYIDWVAGKRYCSLESEGRNCGKRARNKRYYDNNRKKLRKENKSAMRSLRALYKEKGVKK